MERDQDTALRVLARPSFEGRELAIIEMDGREWATSAQASIAVGYSRPDQISDNIRKRWKNEMIDGTDYRVLDGEGLRHLKAAGLVEPNVNSVLLLSRSGLDVVTALAKTDVGRALRRWLADVAMPAWRRGEAVPSPAATPAPAPRTIPTEVLPELRDCPAELVIELTHAETDLGRPLLNLRAAIVVAAGNTYVYDQYGTHQRRATWGDARKLIKTAAREAEEEARVEEGWLPPSQANLLKAQNDSLRKEARALREAEQARALTPRTRR